MKLNFNNNGVNNALTITNKIVAESMSVEITPFTNAILATIKATSPRGIMPDPIRKERTASNLVNLAPNPLPIIFPNIANKMKRIRKMGAASISKRLNCKPILTKKTSTKNRH